ncbi:unnamed protein product [Ranitomeya imitator]|uniref:Transmembrane protein 106A n=1 Tax=Ranitomeya imitator TaxID=111125 RepID=A0ABN9LE87_9NEOB|nr:unnamed protein product [Ranitomeya imitator]
MNRRPPLWEVEPLIHISNERSHVTAEEGKKLQHRSPWDGRDSARIAGTRSVYCRSCTDFHCKPNIPYCSATYTVVLVGYNFNDIMRKVLTLLRPSQNRETEPMLDGQEYGSPPPYISINSNDASTSCNSIEESATVTCPTCRGTGRIPRGQEKELVALIPYSDQRLKPRRTKLYVALAVSCCILVFFLVVFFLYPRSVTLYHAGVNSSVVIIDTASLTVTLQTTNKLNISNNNLFGIEILSLNVEVLHVAVVVGTLTLKEVKKIGPLTTEQGSCHPQNRRADKVRLRRSRSVKTRRGRHRKKLGVPGQETHRIGPPLGDYNLTSISHLSGYIGGLFTALQNAVDKPLMPIFYTVESQVHDVSTYDVCTWKQIHVHNILLHVQ